MKRDWTKVRVSRQAVMKALGRMLAAMAVLLAIAVPTSGAWAQGWHGAHEWHGEHGWSGGHEMHGHFHHGHFHGGFVIGAPTLFWPWYPPVEDYLPPPPTEYIEPGPTGDATPYWYYCPDPPGYYPSVRVCPTGWQTVTASPPPP